MQICPELKNFPHAILRAASSRSAVRSTMTGDLPSELERDRASDASPRRA